MLIFFFYVTTVTLQVVQPVIKILQYQIDNDFKSVKCSIKCQETILAFELKFDCLF